MKITRIETIPIRVPLRPELAIRGRRGVHDVSPFLLVKVHTSEGITGLGESSCTPRWSGEDQVTAAHFTTDVIAPELAGDDPLQIADISRNMDVLLAGNPFTKAAIEMALWDIAGKAAGQPLYRLLGGAIRDRVPTKWSISGREPPEAARIAAWAVEQGFRAMKVKVGIDPEGDIARVRAVREAVGAEVRIGVDANGGWSPDAAVDIIRRLAEFDICFVEQPVAPGDPDMLARVRSQVEIPVVADESVYSPQDARMLARAGAADAFSIYVGKSAGIGPAREIAAIARAASLACTVGSNLELGVGTAAMIHLAVSTPGIEPERFPCDIIGPLYYSADILLEPLPLHPGSARAPEKPGLGVELDPEMIRRYRV